MSQLSLSQEKNNIFLTHLLGSISFPPETPIESAILQKSMLDLYSKNMTDKKCLKLLTGRITLNSHGIIVATKGKDEYILLKDIYSCSALVFTGSKVKSNNKKSYTYFFDNIKPTQQQSIDQNLLQPPVQWTLFKTHKYLLDMKHPPLAAFLIRCKNKPIEIHVFVCESKEKALSLSYSIDMAQRMEIEQPSPVQENYRTSSLNLFKQQSPQQPFISQQNDSISLPEPELPEVIRMLEGLGGGKGTVINPVVKTTNVNLFNDNEFYADPGFDYNGNVGNSNKIKIKEAYNGGKKSVREASDSQYFKQQARKSASIQQLNSLSVFPATSFEELINNKEANYYNIKDNKRTAQPPNQLAIHTKSQPSDSPSPKYSQLQRRKSQNVNDLLDRNKPPKAAHRSTTFVPRDLIDTDMMVVAMDDDRKMGAGESKLKPVAKVQPHKVTGVKVFPDGHDRTFLIPDRDKLKKVTNSEKSDLNNDNKNSSNNNQNSRSSPSNNNFSKNIPTNYYNNYNNNNYKNNGAITPPKNFRSSPLEAVTHKSKNYLEININPNDINKNKNIPSNSNSNNDDGDRVRMDRNESKQSKDIWWSGDFMKKN